MPTGVYDRKNPSTPEKRKIYLREYGNNPANRTRKRNAELVRKYGITWNEKVEMYQQQEGFCGLCAKPLDSEISKAHVDHNHRTGEIRSLVHKGCNTVIGRFENDPDLFENLKNYLDCKDA